MKEKRAFRRSDAGSAPGVLNIGGRRIGVIFDNISLIGARVRTDGTRLPPVGSTAMLNMDDDAGRLSIHCKVVGLEAGDVYRLKFDGYEENSLNNLIGLLRRLTGGTYDPSAELPHLVLDLE